MENNTSDLPIEQEESPTEDYPETTIIAKPVTTGGVAGLFSELAAAALSGAGKVLHDKFAPEKIDGTPRDFPD